MSRLPVCVVSIAACVVLGAASITLTLESTFRQAGAAAAGVKGFGHARHLAVVGSDPRVLVAAFGSADDAPARMRTLKQLVEREGNGALPIVADLLRSERDTRVCCVLLHLIGLFGDMGQSDVLDHYLSDPDPSIRAAAADALGVLHCPAYLWSDPGIRRTLDTDPPILVQDILDRRFRNEAGLAADERQWGHSRRPMLEARSKLLRQMMLGGRTAGEREAAARALLPYPPPEAHLRYAEWGVWIADEAGRLAGIEKIREDIPAFVHRTGDPISVLQERLKSGEGYDILKPVVHLTTNVPIVVSITVLMRAGRPWVAYPCPDDYAISGDWLASSQDHPSPGMPQVEDPLAAHLTDAWQGYPWMLPHHRFAWVVDPLRPLHARPNITGIGLRWQSVVVTPDRAPWMQPPRVPRDAKYQWWERLRLVPASWVTSRSETERFLYYDGSTALLAPTVVARRGQELRFALNRSAAIARNLDKAATMGAGILVNVSAGRVVGEPYRPSRRALLNGEGWYAPIPEQMRYDDAQTRGQFQRLLMDSGLSKEESGALIDCWDERFFRTNGTRYLMVLTKDEYDSFCPVGIRPTPQELARVGLIVTDFGSASGGK